MLLQSHAGFIHLLPALPDVWHEGHLTGVRARGNFTLDIYWHDNNLTQVVVHSGSGVPCRIHYKKEEITFPTETGKDYILKTTNGKLQLVHK